MGKELPVLEDEPDSALVRGIEARSWPSHPMTPSEGMTPAIASKIDDLLEPDAPTSASEPPALTLKEAAATATRGGLPE